MRRRRAALISFSNDVPNYDFLSFRPTSTKPGLHALGVQLKDRPKATIK